MMFNLGFTMEELMFPEHYQSNFLFNMESNYFIDKLDEISPIEDYQEQIIIDDDDWFTIKQLNSDISANDNRVSLINDQILPLTNVFLDNCYLGQVKSMVKLDDTITTLLLPNLSIKVTRDKSNTSSSSDTIPTHSSSPPCNQQLLKSTSTTTQQQKRSTKYMMSKSTSSLSFCTQSSTSMTNSSADELSLNSNDFNELSIIHHSTESMHKLSHHHKNKSSLSDNSLNINRNKRRRKRTIFSAADIEHLKEAFIQNPKPNQQDIAVLSEQLGHDSYVIRVWFYNKRQATKKSN